MASALFRVFMNLSEQGKLFLKTIFFGYPPEKYLPALVNVPYYEQINFEQENLTTLWNDSILWAVPKKRRTIEKRRCRKFGYKHYFYKMLLPKTNILICQKCGSYHEATYLCPNCYAKIREETSEMQAIIEKSLGISPAENEVVVLYQDDERLNPEYYQGKRVVEIKKNRPKLFSDNLLQRSTQGLAKTKEVSEKK